MSIKNNQPTIGDPVSYTINTSVFQKTEQDYEGIPVLINGAPIGVVHSIHKGLANVSLWGRFLESEMVGGKTVALVIPSDFGKKVGYE